MKTNDFKAMGFLTLSNLGGIEIEINDTCEFVRYKYFGKIGQRPCQIHYTNAGRAYFRAIKRRFYLDEFMRIKQY